MDFVNLRILTALAAATLALGGCAEEAEQGQAGQEAGSETENETLAQAIAGADNLSSAAKALGDVGLAPVFDGAGSYTILVPNNDAFAALGEVHDAGAGTEHRAALAAILRDHIVPGYLTPADIGAAIDAQGGTVRAETMGEQTLRFSRDGESIRVTSDDGSSALIAGEALRASNGVAIPLDGVLKDLTPA
ncbi:hypothetical protein GRI75_08630 [Altererythrobacter soli]|uniref:FAS1 domain-containing protein n=1 Tax=Croceibacterium soli TaxID=1739690 RepID=A0A6I4UTA3_9SPHN|nr:fasciclin domain-containing protein [Croceibacterium soli]MXP41706.1 hypothetical protein [Croceibacterium soli]